MLLWGPPFVGPKNARFGHGFEKNLIKNLVSLSLSFCVKFLGVHHAVNIHLFFSRPFVGSMFVSQAQKFPTTTYFKTIRFPWQQH